MSIHQEISPEEATQSALVAYLDELLHVRPVSLPKLAPTVVVDIGDVESSVSREPVQVLEPVSPAALPDERKAQAEELSSNTRLACLYIRSDDQTYALALQQLGRIFPVSERRLTALPGQASWQLGLLAGEEVLQAISLHHLLHAQIGRMPRYFVSIAGSRRVLACEAILHSVQLTPEQLHWRAHQRRHPLVVATIRADLVPLLDLRRLDECLS